MNQLNYIIDSVTQALKRVSGIRALWLVGSVIDFPDQCNDIDFLAGFYSGTFLSKNEMIVKLINSKLKKENRVISDDAIRFVLFDKTISIAVYFLPQLFERIRQYIEGIQIDGQHRPWATGYWIPEALCADLVNSKIIYDEIDAGAQINKLLVPYSTKMGQAIINSCFTEVSIKTQRVSRLSCQSIEYAILRSDLITALIRMAFAISEVYFRGFSHLNRQQDSLSKDGLRLYKLAQKVSLQPQIRTQEILEALKDLKGVKYNEEFNNERN